MARSQHGHHAKKHGSKTHHSRKHQSHDHYHGHDGHPVGHLTQHMGHGSKPGYQSSESIMTMGHESGLGHKNEGTTLQYKNTTMYHHKDHLAVSKYSPKQCSGKME